MIEELLKSPDSREALEWLSEGAPGTRTLGELSTTESSIALVKTFYSLGAERVTAVEIDKYDTGEENTGKLILTLPDDPTAREKLFEFCGKLAEDLGFDPEVDQGQELLFLMLD